MASIRKRNNTYTIRVFCGYDSNHRQISKYMTYKPEPGMTAKQIEKEVQRQATLFEERCRRGQVLDENITFAEFAETWLADKEKDLRPKTFDRYKSMLPRINAAIGHMKLCHIQPPHLRAFYKNLGESGIRQDTKFKCNISVDDYLRENSLSTAELCRRSGISNTTMISIRKGNNVNQANAEKLAAALKMPLQELFTPVGKGEKTLSDVTILHHHRLISVILHTAVLWGVLYSNPCDRTEPPKAVHKEARYIEESDVSNLFELLNDVDIMHRTLVRLLAFSGMRRGEILGLKWSDLNFSSGMLSIRRSLQYSAERGLYEGRTKNKSSERDIRLSSTVLQDLRKYKVWQLEQQLMLGDQWQNTGYMFTNDFGNPLHPDTVSSWFSGFIKKHPEIPPISLHSLRHTNATLQLAAGVPITTVAKRLGHTTPTTTGNVYAHAIRSADDNAAELLEDIMIGNKDNNCNAG